MKINIVVSNRLGVIALAATEFDEPQVSERRTPGGRTHQDNRDRFRQHIGRTRI